MKKLNKVLMALIGAMILTLTACVDECDDVTCQNGGSCDSGDCTCATNYYGETCADYCLNGTYNGGDCDCEAGYEGVACDGIVREKFIGDYNTSGTLICDETGSSALPSFSVSITESPSSLDQILVDAGGSNLILVATVDGTSFTFEETVRNGFTYTGTGSIEESVLSISMFEYDASVPETCVYTLDGAQLE